MAKRTNPARPSTHATRIDVVDSNIWLRGGRRAIAFRWRCSCGRVGPERILKDNAARGGRQHARIAQATESLARGGSAL